MPWLLYRYILGDVLKVFGLCAGVLVMVAAFGVAIKPLAGDDLIGPWQTAKYIMLACVPMLQFALPFAAGFAATIVLHRMTSDNEVLAAAAVGISYVRILLPLVVLGVVLLVVMVALTQWIIPRFWALMERNVAADVTRVVQTSIQKGLPVQIGNLQIYADRLHVQSHPRDTDAETRLILYRVAAAELDDTGQIIADVTARQAVVDVHRHEGRTYLMLALVDTVAFDARTGELIQTPQFKPDRAIPVPGGLKDDPMFMTREELLRLHEHPDDYRRIISAKVSLAESLRARDVRSYIGERLAADGLVELVATDGRLVIEADRLKGPDFATNDGRPVEVKQYDAAGLRRQVSAAAVTIRPAVASTLSNPTMDLVITDCQVIDLRSGGAANQRARLTIPSLVFPELAADLSRLPYEQLLARAEGLGGSVERRAQHLLLSVANLRREIDSRLVRRYALSLTGFLLLVLGATLAMWLRHSLPLVIYVWAFVPSAVDLILISGGESMVQKDLVTSGFIIMWSGNALLALIWLYAFMRLARN